MITEGRAGFTVIEVMLFLAISGILVVAILIGSGVRIASQRYKDAVVTLQSDIQQLYEDAVHVQNERLAKENSCTNMTIRAGASGCIILGTLFTIENSGQGVGLTNTYQVIGSEPNKGGVELGEIDLIKSYMPRIVPANSRSGTMEWGTGLDRTSLGTKSISLAVLRSPRSGAVYTFSSGNIISPESSADISAMVNKPNVAEITICVDDTGWSVPQKMAINIKAAASTANSVEVMTYDMLDGREGVNPCRG